METAQLEALLQEQLGLELQSGESPKVAEIIYQSFQNTP
jgi:hypothetical protein